MGQFSESGFEDLQSIATNVKLARKDVFNLRTIVEDRSAVNLQAFYDIATTDQVGWRARSRKILLYVGDTPGYEGSCNNGTIMSRERQSLH